MKLEHIEAALTEHHLSPEQVFVELVRRVIGIDLIPTIARIEAEEVAQVKTPEE